MPLELTAFEGVAALEEAPLEVDVFLVLAADFFKVVEAFPFTLAEVVVFFNETVAFDDDTGFVARAVFFAGVAFF